MKRFDTRIKTVNGKEYELSYLGSWNFAEFWLNKEDDTVFIFSRNAIHDAMALYSDMDNKHVPTIKRIGYEERIVKSQWESFYIYTMPHYGPLKAKNRKAWAQYRVLRDLYDESLFETQKYRKAHGWDILGHGWIFDRATMFENLVENSDLPQSLKDAISDIRERMQDCGSACFDWSIMPSCMGIDQEENLVLVSPAFDRDMIENRM